MLRGIPGRCALDWLITLCLPHEHVSAGGLVHIGLSEILRSSGISRLCLLIIKVPYNYRKENKVAFGLAAYQQHKCLFNAEI